MGDAICGPGGGAGGRADAGVSGADDVGDTVPPAPTLPPASTPPRDSKKVRWGSIVAGINTALFAPLFARAIVERAGGFGYYDVVPFAILTLPLGVAVSVCAAAVFRLSWRASRWQNGVALFAGAVIGVLYAIAVQAFTGPMLFAYSFPVLYLWGLASAIGLWIGHYVAGIPGEAERAKPVVTKRMLLGCLGTAGVLVSVPFLYATVQVMRLRANGSVYLIPDGYIGPVVIAYDDSAGVAEEREGRRRTYRVPRTGMMRARFGRDRGFAEFYYVRADGVRTRIPGPGACDEQPSGDPVMVCIGTYFTVSAAPSVDYVRYHVGRFRDQASIDARSARVVDSALYGRIQQR